MKFPSSWCGKMNGQLVIQRTLYDLTKALRVFDALQTRTRIDEQCLVDSRVLRRLEPPDRGKSNIFLFCRVDRMLAGFDPDLADLEECLSNPFTTNLLGELVQRCWCLFVGDW